MLKKIFFIIATIFLSTGALANDFTIDITEGNIRALPIQIFKFAAPNAPRTKAAFDFSSVIQADLKRSGRFSATRHFAPFDGSNWQKWPVARWAEGGHDYVLWGRIESRAAGYMTVFYELIDVARARQLSNQYAVNSMMTNTAEIGRAAILLSKRLKVREDANLRFIAHRMSDGIYEAVLGKRGAFATKIAYVDVDYNAAFPFRLFVADSDGERRERIAASKYPFMSPSWSPDGERLAYVSFEGRTSQIIVQSIYQNQRQIVAKYSGINSAPSWSPDGKKLAFVLSKDGNPEIYTYDLAARQLTRLTKHFGIDTEPRFSNDGSQIYFTSDRGGQPQIYALNLATGRAGRVTFEGDYNTSAIPLPDGTGLVMIHRRAGAYHLAKLTFKTNTVDILSQKALDQSPALSPNGEMILYASQARGQEGLHLITIDGGYKTRLNAQRGRVKSPAWSSYL